MSDSFLRKLEVLVKDIESEFKEKHSFSLFEISVSVIENGFEITGNILTKKQHSYLLQKIKEVYPEYLIDNVVILEDKENSECYSIGVEQQRVDVIDLWASPLMNKLSTQILKGDYPFAVLLRENEMALVKTADGSLGWMPVSVLEFCEHRLWDFSISHPPFNITKNQEIGVRNKIWETAQQIVGAPYLLGGRSVNKGLDCSGLTQYVYFNSCKILLPKHSTDQMKLGNRLALKDSEKGDLVFLRHKEKSFSHVGIFSGKSLDLMIHASREIGEVVCESSSEIFTKYSLMGARSFIVIVDQP